MAVTLQDFMVGTVLVVIIIFGAFAFIQEQNNNTGQTSVQPELNALFNDTTNNYNQSVILARDIRNNLQTSSLVSVTGFAALFSASYSVLRLILNSIFLPLNIFSDISDAVGLPDWFFGSITVIIVLVVGLIIANVIFGRGRA